MAHDSKKHGVILRESDLGSGHPCNAPKYTLVVFNMLGYFVSIIEFFVNLILKYGKSETRKILYNEKDKIVNGPKRGIKDMDYEIRGQNTILGNWNTNS